MQIQYIYTINVQFCILQQLLKLSATNLNAKMKSTYKILPHPDKYPCVVLNNIIGSCNSVNYSMSVSTGVSNTSEFRYSHRNNEGDSGQIPRRQWNRSSPSNAATRKYSWNAHRIIFQISSCLWCYSKYIRDICQSSAESCTPMSCLHWGWWPSIWATVVRCKMVR